MPGVLLVPLLALALSPFPAVIGWVFDGDSLIVRRGSERIEVRLWGIDCPEHGQPFGRAAKRFVIGLKGRRVTVTPLQRDQYGRLVARLTLDDGNDLGRLLISKGHAWWFRRYAPHFRPYRQAEAAARRARVGLWSDPNPIPPWRWRREHKPR